MDDHIDRHFTAPLEKIGFKKINSRKWVRSTKLPIRELFGIQALKGGLYAPAWGFSTGEIPSWRRQFTRQSTDKNSVMDLVVDVRNFGENVPLFGFITGYNTEAPAPRIRACAEFSIPRAVSDFDRVRSRADFCALFREYRDRFARGNFGMWAQHQIVPSFMLLWEGEHEAGLKELRDYCERSQLNFEDKVLQEYISRAVTPPRNP